MKVIHLLGMDNKLLCGRIRVGNSCYTDRKKVLERLDKGTETYKICKKCVEEARKE